MHKYYKKFKNTHGGVCIFKTSPKPNELVITENGATFCKINKKPEKLEESVKPQSHKKHQHKKHHHHRKPHEHTKHHHHHHHRHHEIDSSKPPHEEPKKVPHPSDEKVTRHDKHHQKQHLKKDLDGCGDHIKHVYKNSKTELYFFEQKNLDKRNNKNIYKSKKAEGEKCEMGNDVKKRHDSKSPKRGVKNLSSPLMNHPFLNPIQFVQNAIKNGTSQNVKVDDKKLIIITKEKQADQNEETEHQKKKHHKKRRSKSEKEKEPETPNIFPQNPTFAFYNLADLQGKGINSKITPLETDINKHKSKDKADKSRRKRARKNPRAKSKESSESCPKTLFNNLHVNFGKCILMEDGTKKTSQDDPISPEHIMKNKMRDEASKHKHSSKHHKHKSSSHQQNPEVSKKHSNHVVNNINNNNNNTSNNNNNNNNSISNHNPSIKEDCPNTEIDKKIEPSEDLLQLETEKIETKPKINNNFLTTSISNFNGQNLAELFTSSLSNNSGISDESLKKHLQELFSNSNYKADTLKKISQFALSQNMCLVNDKLENKSSSGSNKTTYDSSISYNLNKLLHTQFTIILDLQNGKLKKKENNVSNLQNNNCYCGGVYEISTQESRTEKTNDILEELLKIGNITSNEQYMHSETINERPSAEKRVFTAHNNPTIGWFDKQQTRQFEDKEVTTESAIKRLECAVFNVIEISQPRETCNKYKLKSALKKVTFPICDNCDEIGDLLEHKKQMPQFKRYYKYDDTAPEDSAFIDNLSDYNLHNDESENSITCNAIITKKPISKTILLELIESAKELAEKESHSQGKQFESCTDDNSMYSSTQSIRFANKQKLKKKFTTRKPPTTPIFTNRGCSPIQSLTSIKFKNSLKKLKSSNSIFDTEGTNAVSKSSWRPISCDSRSTVDHSQTGRSSFSSKPQKLNAHFVQVHKAANIKKDNVKIWQQNSLNRAVEKTPTSNKPRSSSAENTVIKSKSILERRQTNDVRRCRNFRKGTQSFNDSFKKAQLRDVKSEEPPPSQLPIATRLKGLPATRKSRDPTSKSTKNTAMEKSKANKSDDKTNKSSFESQSEVNPAMPRSLRPITSKSETNLSQTYNQSNKEMIKSTELSVSKLNKLKKARIRSTSTSTSPTSRTDKNRTSVRGSYLFLTKDFRGTSPISSYHLRKIYDKSVKEQLKIKPHRETDNVLMEKKLPNQVFEVRYVTVDSTQTTDEYFNRSSNREDYSSKSTEVPSTTNTTFEPPKEKEKEKVPDSNKFFLPHSKKKVKSLALKVSSKSLAKRTNTKKKPNSTALKIPLKTISLRHLKRNSNHYLAQNTNSGKKRATSKIPVYKFKKRPLVSTPKKNQMKPKPSLLECDFEQEFVVQNCKQYENLKNIAYLEGMLSKSNPSSPQHVILLDCIDNCNVSTICLLQKSRSDVTLNRSKNLLHAKPSQPVVSLKDLQRQLSSLEIKSKTSGSEYQKSLLSETPRSENVNETNCVPCSESGYSSEKSRKLKSSSSFFKRKSIKDLLKFDCGGKRFVDTTTKVNNLKSTASNYEDLKKELYDKMVSDCKLYAQKIKRQSSQSVNEKTETDDFKEIPLLVLLGKSPKFTSNSVSVSTIGDVSSTCETLSKTFRSDEKRSDGTITGSLPSSKKTHSKLSVFRVEHYGEESKISMDVYPTRSDSCFEMRTKNSSNCSDLIISKVSSDKLINEKAFLNNLLDLYEKENDIADKLCEDETFFNTLLNEVNVGKADEKCSSRFRNLFKRKVKKPSKSCDVEENKNNKELSRVSEEDCFTLEKAKSLPTMQEFNAELCSMLASKARKQFSSLVKAANTNKLLSNELKLFGFSKLLEQISQGDFSSLKTDNENEQFLEERVKCQLRAAFKSAHKIASGEKKCKLSKLQLGLLKSFVGKYRFGLHSHIEAVCVSIGRGLINSEKCLEDALNYLVNVPSEDEINLDEFLKSFSASV